MFTSKAQIAKKTGKYGVGRFSFLQSLVTEYQDTTSEDAKQQVLANLANFAYDPVNYEHLRELKVIDLFLDCVNMRHEQMTQFALAGVCNLCLDKTNKQYILQNDGVNTVVSCLSSSNEETVLTAITTLMYLVTPESRADITSSRVVDVVRQFARSCNPRLRNLSVVFLEDYCNLKVQSDASSTAAAQ